MMDYEENGMIFFDGRSGKYGFLSNDHQESFKVSAMIFTSMTQYMLYCKARLFEDMEAARDILNGWEPSALKLRGREVKGFDPLRWNGRQAFLLCRGLKAKFDQNPKLIAELVKTGNKTLVCCDSGDLVLGNGMYLHSSDRAKTEEWKGQNLLGFALMDLRSIYQNEMPEGIRLRLQDRLGKGSRPDLIGALKGGDFRHWDEEPVRYLPYEGDEPYIYLNYSLRDISVARRVTEILNRLGFHVWYDRFLDDGRLWSSERSDAVERCFVLMDIENGEENVSHVRIFAREFADMVGIPVLEAYVYHKDRKPEPEGEEEDDIEYIDAEAGTEEFERQCLKLLEKNGLTPGMKYPEGAKKREPSWDLGMDHYKYYGEDRGWFKNSSWYRCNLRTRESFFIGKEREKEKKKTGVRQGRCVDLDPDPLFVTDEEVYRSSVWKCRSFQLIRKSPEPDYIGLPEDWKFDARLAALRGGLVKEIAAEYKEARKRQEQSERDYPYMDEFEYLSSKFDD